MLTDEEQETLNTYNKIALGWAGTLKQDFWKEEYNKFKGYLSSGKIIDLGCGSGRDSLWFTEQGYAYTGVDISDEMVKLAQAQNPKAKFLVQSFYDLNFPAENFDGFWSACSLIHVPKEKIRPVLGKIKTILKSGDVGFVAIKEGSGKKMQEWQKSGRKRFFEYYLQDEFAKLLTDAGFKILESYKRPPGKYDQDGTFLVYYIKAE